MAKTPSPRSASHPASPGRAVRGVHARNTLTPNGSSTEIGATGTRVPHTGTPTPATAVLCETASARAAPSNVLFVVLSSVLEDRVKENVLNTADTLEERYRALVAQKRDAEQKDPTQEGASSIVDTAPGVGTASKALSPLRSRESGPHGQDNVLFTDPTKGLALSETLPWLFCRRYVCMLSLLLSTRR
jgi:hypothetical protein